MSGDIQSRYHFGEFELSPAEHSLKRGGKTIDLAPKEFKTLLLLAEQGGTVVGKDTFIQEVWDGAFVGDGSLARTISVLRRHIGPDAIETVPRLGYRFALPVTKTEPADHPPGAASPARPSPAGQGSNQPQAKISHLPGKRTMVGALAAITVLALAFPIAWWLLPTPIPVVESITPLTDDREPKGHTMVSDGSRIYFNEGRSGHLGLAQVSAAGGSTASIETRFAISYALGIANDGSALIVQVPSGPVDEFTSDASLWSVPLPAGEPRCLINSGVQNATALPDGRIIFATFVQGKDPKGTDSRTDWFIARNDGSNRRKLVSLPGYAGEVDVSRDGRRILLSQGIVGDSRLFDIAVDGTGLREIRKLSEDECCFAWTPDEKYLVYESGHGQQSDIWALPLKAGLFRRPGKPVRLTNGPLSYSAAYPSRDGKRIFVVGTKWRGELVRYDMKSQAFVPFLSGISATDPTFSQDGKWVVYATYPDGNLWRSRSDGSERVQLTFPPVAAFFPSISPDGKKVAFHTSNTENGVVFVVNVEGGPPKRIDDNAAYASWSPDGNYLLYGGYSAGTPGPLRIADVRSQKKSVIPLSQGKDSGFWLSQDTLIVRNDKHTSFLTFDLKTQKWAYLNPGNLGETDNWLISPDRKYLYYTLVGEESKVMRLRVADHQVETITSLKDLHRAVNNGATQINVAPDGSPIFTRDVGYDEIYALNVRWP